MKSKVSPTAIGIFISGAVLILFFSVIIFGSGKMFRKTKPYLLTFQEPVTGLKSGSAVKLMGVDIGASKEVWLGVSEDGSRELVNVVIELDRKRLNQLFRHHPFLDMDDRVKFDELVKEKGLRGRLNVLSMLSGTLYIELNLYPDRPGFQLDDEETHGYWEIPTIPSEKTKLMTSLVTSLENLTKFDFGGASEEVKGLLGDLRKDLDDLQFKKVGEGLVGTLDKADTLLGNPDLKVAISNLNLTMANMKELSGKLNKEANPLLAQADDDLKKAAAMLEEAKETLTALKAQVEPNSTLTRELISTLDEARESMNAIREFALQLQRNPNELITGKEKPKQ